MVQPNKNELEKSSLIILSELFKQCELVTPADLREKLLSILATYEKIYPRLTSTDAEITGDPISNKLGPKLNIHFTDFGKDSEANGVPVWQLDLAFENERYLNYNKYFATNHDLEYK
jgi:hypothetical protein